MCLLNYQSQTFRSVARILNTVLTSQKIRGQVICHLGDEKDPAQRVRGTTLKSNSKSGQTQLLRIPTYTTDSETDDNEISDRAINSGENHGADLNSNDSVEYATNLHLNSLTGGHSKFTNSPVYSQPISSPYICANTQKDKA